MKANELMIGDLVQGNPCGQHCDRDNNTYYKIAILDIGNHCWGYSVCGALVELKYDDIFPIPLTADILEKNGFKPYIPENHLETIYACQDVSKAVADELYALWPYQDGSFYLLLRVDGKDMVRMDVHYIHQLQQALRLCGIKKGIVL